MRGMSESESPERETGHSKRVTCFEEKKEMNKERRERLKERVMNSPAFVLRCFLLFSPD